MTDIETAPSAPRYRRVFTAVGIGGLVLVAAALGLYGIAFLNGVHCPECDRTHLGSRYASWHRYFIVLDSTLGAGGVAALGSLLFAQSRRWGILAFILAVLFLLLRPM